MNFTCKISRIGYSFAPFLTRARGLTTLRSIAYLLRLGALGISNLATSHISKEKERNMYYTKPFLFLLFFGCSLPKETSSSDTQRTNPPPVTQPPVVAKEQTCGIYPPRPCSRAEKRYIKTMSYFLDHMENLKDLNDLLQWFTLENSRPQDPMPALDEAKVLFLGENHTQFGPIFDTTTLLNALAEKHKENREKMLVLVEGIAAKSTTDCTLNLLHGLYNVWENSRQQPEYNPATWDSLNAARVGLHFDTMHNIDFTRSALPTLACRGWDWTVPENNTAANRIKRNQTLVETVQHYQNTGEYDRIVVIAGRLHLPVGEYAYVKQMQPSAALFSFHDLYGSQRGINYQRIVLSSPLETNDIYNFMKTQDGLYVTQNIVHNTRFR